MKLNAFETRTFGKWILAGEHTVLRGSPAVVFPLRSRELHFKYTPRPEAKNLDLQLQGTNGAELELLFRGVLEKSLELKKLSKSDLHGLVEITSSLPIGAGLGASASLCVALTRWLQMVGLVDESEKHEFARQLENLFHGESSGVDIAVVSEERGLIYTKGGGRDFFSPAWVPRLYISFCGQRGITYECVTQVKKILENDPTRGEEIDARMKKAVQMCLNGMKEVHPTSFNQLADAIELAGSCFKDWSLTDGALTTHMKKLKVAGASAVKPTGSGGGGYVLSLWKDEPPTELKSELISCF